MRLPRNIKMLRGPVDPSALAGTLFLLWIATLLHSSLVFPPGLRMRLPEASGLLGDALPDLAVAIDGAGRLLYEQQIMSESNLQVRLRQQTALRGTNLTLLLLVDRKVPAEAWTRLVSLAQSAGIHEVIFGTSPRLNPSEGATRSPPRPSGKGP